MDRYISEMMDGYKNSSQYITGEQNFFSQVQLLVLKQMCWCLCCGVDKGEKGAYMYSDAWRQENYCMWCI